jgi:hypothetical protein
MTERKQPMAHVMAQHTLTKEIKEHTREGATSEIIMNGTGPRPTAKDLGSRVSSREEGKPQKDLHHEDENCNA